MLDEGDGTLDEEWEDYPTTWEGLCSLLEDAQCSEVAVELKKALGTAT